MSRGSEEFSNYFNEFRDLINNHHILLSDEYSDIVEHVDTCKLSYPGDATIYFYNGDLYSENLAFRVKDEMYTPIRAVYSGSVLILDETSSSGDVEPTHLPEERSVRLATLTYMAYMAVLWAGLGMMIMRLRMRAALALPEQEKAEIAAEEKLPTVKKSRDLKLMYVLIGLAVALVILLWRLILWFMS